MTYLKQITAMFLFSMGNLFYNSDLNWLLDFVNAYTLIAWFLFGMAFSVIAMRHNKITFIVFIINSAMGAFGFILPFMAWSETRREDNA